MQLKLCWIWLQQVWVWLLWQWLYAEKKTLTRKHFLKLSAEEKDQYMRYINMSRHYISDYVVTLTPYSEEVNKTVESNREPKALFHNVSNYDLFVWMHYYSARDTNITWQRQILSLRMTGRGFLRGIDCTCWLTEKTLQEISNDEKLYSSLLGRPEVKHNVIPLFVLKSFLV